MNALNDISAVRFNGGLSTEQLSLSRFSDAYISGKIGTNSVPLFALAPLLSLLLVLPLF